MRQVNNRDGNVSLIAAVFMLAIVVMVAAGLELSRVASMKDGLQRALDSGILAAARLIDATDAERTTTAQAFVDSNLDGRFDGSPVTVTVVADPDTGVLNATATTRASTDFSSAVGISYFDVTVDSHVRFVARRRLEIALVLDTTGSMDGAKIETLKTAATDLITTVVKDGDDLARVSVVPFAQYVNVGVDHRDHYGIDGPDDVPGTEECTTETVGTGCYWVSGYCWNGRYYYYCSYQQCSGYEDVETCALVGQQTWEGCVGSRTSPNNTIISSPGNPVPGFFDIDCPTPITRLTSTVQTLTDAITALPAYGWTYIPAGMVWGWRALDPGHPFPDGVDPAVSKEDVVKAMVVMTDGANTRALQSGGSLHTNESGADANAVTTTLCNGIKADQIQIYTVAFEVTDTTIKTLLENCASETGMYHDAVNASQLKSAFEDIARDLTEMHLSG